MRIGDVAFAPGNFEPDIDRAAPPHLDGITQPRHRGWLAHQTQIGDVADSTHMVDERQRAEARRAFLVPGDDEADGPGLGRHPRSGGDHGGNGPFHVHRAAPIEQIAATFGRKGRAGPAFAGRHHIDMAGKGEMAASFRPLADGEQVLHRAIRRLASDKPVHHKAERCQLALQTIEHQPGGGGYAGAGNQCLGKAGNVACGINSFGHVLWVSKCSGYRKWHGVQSCARPHLAPWRATKLLLRLGACSKQTATARPSAIVACSTREPTHHESARHIGGGNILCCAQRI